MNEQLQAELIKIVTTINNGTGTAWDFLQEQTPDVIQQLLMWHGIKSFVAFCISIMFIITGFILTKKIYKQSKVLSDKAKVKDKDNPYGYYDPFPYIAMWVAPLLVCILVTPLLVFGNLEWLQIWVAPKVWILEYIRSLAV